MSEIERRFNETFSHWNISLPPDDLANRERGKIVEAGWAIWYLFGSDGEGEYLDYYACHRMTNDRHTRLRASGEQENLEAVQSMYVVSRDPEENARLEAEFFARNRRIEKMLREKGFGMIGDEPLLTQVNRQLYLKQKED